MIKILPEVKTISRPIRNQLKTSSSLKVLAGSSMSGWHAPRFYETEMIIPGGMSLKEKAYFLLRGKIPSSVRERWVPAEDNIAHEGDQLITVNMTSNGAVGGVVENPHDFIPGSDDISNSFSDGGDLTGSGSDIDTFEIFKHLAGFQ